MQGNVGENNNASEQDKRPTSHIGGDDKKTHSTAILSGTRAEEHGKEDHNSRHAPESTSLEVQEVDEFGLPAKKFNRPPSVGSSASSGEFDSAEESLPAGPGVATKDSVRNTPTETKVETDANPHRGLDGPARNGETSVEREVNSTAESKTVDDDKKRDHEAFAASHDAQPEPVDPPSPSEPRQEAKDTSKPQRSEAEKLAIPEENHDDLPPTYASEWSHQQIVPQTKDKKTTEEDNWQEMPAFAPFDLYNDDGKLIAREAEESDDEAKTYAGLGGAGKGYTKVNLDEDAQSATSMDENTKYLFKDPAAEEGGENEDEEGRDALAQLQATKDLLTEQQRIAYVGLARVAMVGMIQEFYDIETTRGTKKDFRIAIEALKMWSQKTMVRLYAHMDISPAEQLMIEQLPEHGVEPGDLTPTLMQNARVKNPNAKQESPQATPRPDSVVSDIDSRRPSVSSPTSEAHRDSPSPPALEETEGGQLPEVRIPSQLESTKQIDIDLRWTVLCDLFLVLISDSIYDARSRVLLERVGSYLGVPWLDICTFEKRVTEALEMQEAADKENWNEDEHMENRRKLQIKRRMVMMGIATVGGGLVIGLSAGLLAPVIGAGLAAGFTTVGVAGTSGFLAGAGGAAVITSTGIVTGGAIAVRASSRRMGSVKTFEYRPLHNNKRVNLIVTVSGWMNGKVDDVRLPYSTVDPIMGDVYSILWEPEMLQSMGQTINILATEALTQGLQQILGSTVLVALMASLQLPIVLTKLSYLIDNPWTVSLDRANSAGLILADSLIDRNLGVRPVTLVGFSLGSRVIFSCLRELAKRGAFGLVQNVYMFGAPVVAKKDDYLRIRSIVSGRMVNGYAKNDWILGYLFRATSGGIMRVAGLAPVEDVPMLENVDVTELVPGHMAYRAAMPRLLREVGWSVESDEFAEIEEPDPENHDQRQREIIREMDEARKEMEKKPEKRRFGIFSRQKKIAKKEWETYDEKAAANGLPESSEKRDTNVLFDIDAIKAELASEQIEIREIPSTLPPMRLDLKREQDGGDGTAQGPYSNPRMSKSWDVTPTLQTKDEATSSRDPSLSTAQPLKNAAASGGSGNDHGSSRMPSEITTSSAISPTGLSSRPPSYEAQATSAESGVGTAQAARPGLRSSVSAPLGTANVDRNAWKDDDDDDEFNAAGKEVTMSFE